MSKLGAICDKLRQIGPSVEPNPFLPVDLTGSGNSSSKREVSSTNAERKSSSFLPVDLTGNGSSSLKREASLTALMDGNGKSNPLLPVDLTGNGNSSTKREASPSPIDEEPSQRLNKRKNFRPVSNTSRNGSSAVVLAPSSSPNTPTSVDEEVFVKKTNSWNSTEENCSESSSGTSSAPNSGQTSVIVRNPKASIHQERSRQSTMYLPPKIMLQQRNDPREDVILHSRKESHIRSPSPPASSSSFYQTQVFPFMDYQNMMFDAHLRQLDKEQIGRLDILEDDDDESLDDSEDGKFSNGERQTNSADEKPAVNRKRRENSSHDSANGWKWSGVRNSIRSLDIWQYVKHFRSDETCHSPECRSLGLKEHFHCLTCINPNKVIFRKEEMIRHVKWHKKRDETLQLGFLRFSGNDDCLQQFQACPHAGRQTHYHCLIAPCQKVYTSTSDVQMHANLHRKEMAINKEGFQRYRAMDDCREDFCPFRQQKSTHFHCIRSDCAFTFKNKADMEKHKAYHAKNDELAKDGFRKYMKYEHCLFDSCPYSKIMNHIHCIRSGCRYVFTSSAQLHAHKRKHDRNSNSKSSDGAEIFLPIQSCSSNASSDMDGELPAVNGLYGFSSDDEDEINSPQSSMDLRALSSAFENSDKIQKEKVNFNAALLRAAEAANMRRQPSGADFLTHINHEEPAARKNMSLSHSTLHIDNRHGSPYSDFLTSPYPSSAHNELFHLKNFPKRPPFLSAPNSSNVNGPTTVINTAPHSMNSPLNSTMASMQPSYPQYKRKRGRPPKNPVVDVHIFPSAPNSNRNPQAMFSSFKIGKGGVLMDIRQESAAGHRNITNGHTNPPEKAKERNVLPKLSQFTEPMPNKSPHCNYQSCSYEGRDHYHCTHPRCHFGSERDDILALHTREFHANIIILEGYEFFDQCVDCGLAGCPSNRLTRHFHCCRPSCLYSFVRYDTMGTHEEKHRLALSCGVGSTPSPGDSDPNRNHVKTEASEIHTSNGKLVKSEPNTPEFQEKRFFYHPMLSKMHFSAEQPCALQGRCRLAEREHFHCNRCEFAYTSPLRLQTHLTKCQVEPTQQSHPSFSRSPSFIPSPSPLQSQFSMNSVLDFSTKNSTPSPENYSDSESETMKEQPNGENGNRNLDANGDTNGNLYGNGNEETNGNVNEDANGNGMSKIKFISMAFPHVGRVNGQQQPPIVEGFQRYLCTEGCDWEECPLSRKQTHWHCMEEHCRQFFSDKTRLERHSERHRRLSTIIGEDFRRYSAKVTCDDVACTLKSSSHVHCLHCDFVCTETAKIATHRRGHSKQNAVKNAGFDKYSFRSPCSVSSCLYYTQTHYHCKTCSVVVNTMSQMQAHQNKHDQKCCDESSVGDFNCDLASNSF